MNKVLITGGGGFLGCRIGNEFLSKGYEVVSFDSVNSNSTPGIRSVIGLIESAAFVQLLLDYQPDLLIHSAGTASVQKSLQEPSVDFSSNVSITARVLETLRTNASKCKVILLSSAAVYGNPRILPISESTPINPISPYGYHKYFAEQLLREYYEVFGQKSCVLRIFSAYGPGLKKQLLWDICQKSATQEKIELMGTGDETRDFIHVSDISRAVLFIANNAPFNNDIYNVASGNQVSTKKIAEELLQSIGCYRELLFFW